MVSLPRVVIAAAASGQGKTTVAVGLMAALTRAGHHVAPAKVGPDFIDPGYHALATERPGRNLDPWLCGERLILPLLAHGHLTPEPAALSIIEGVMGLYDGRIGTDGFASTAHIAALTASPVIVVLDISSAARTIAATVHGLATFDPTINIAGVILNKSGSDRHANEVRRSVEATGYRVLGVLPRDAGVSAPSRHLGLVPVAERRDAAIALDILAEQTATYLDIDGVRRIAESAPDIDTQPWRPDVVERSQRPVVAVAGGRAFTFRYAETDELLRAQGAEPVVFDPARDTELPEGTSALYLGGGFPEMHAAELAGNDQLKRRIAEAVSSGMPTVAECAGMIYLADSLDGHAFAGAIAARAAMGPRLTLQYHRAELAVDSILGEAGLPVTAHEFHRTRITPVVGTSPAWQLAGGHAGRGRLDGGQVGGARVGFALDPARTGRATVHASYLHTHWAGTPSMAASFVDAAVDYATRRGSRSLPADLGVPRRLRCADGPVDDHRSEVPPVAGPDPVDDRWVVPGLKSLEHHGDAELAEGLVDLAVNVRDSAPPQWLAERLKDAVVDVAPYPSARSARTAIARRHGVRDEMVLPTNGAAEAFTLIARALPIRRAVIVHPQFTEPESALRRAGITPDRVLLSSRDGFVLHPAAVPEDADLVVVGNPTNPTGVLHPRGVLESLHRPGRILVVDEAFSDTVPGEPHTLIEPGMADTLVIRSLTKTWSIAGLRAGYLIGDEQLITRLAEQQPHWSVSSMAAVAMEQTAAPAAVAEAEAGARTLQQNRAELLAGLQRLGLRPVAGHAPFVLVQVGAGVRGALRSAGYAVRSCASFPGLDDTWIRIAVRDRRTIDRFLSALGQIISTETLA